MFTMPKSHSNAQDTQGTEMAQLRVTLLDEETSSTSEENISIELQPSKPETENETEVDVYRKEAFQAFPLSRDATLEDWLAHFHLTRADLKREGVDQTALEALFQIEKSVWSSLRWSNIDYLLEKILHFPVLSENDVSTPMTRHRIQDKRLWLSGRGLPMQQESDLKRAYAATGFRQGAEFILMRGIDLSLAGLLLYQFFATLTSGQILSFRQFINVYLSADENSVFGLIHALKNPQLRFLMFIIAAPFIWGGIKAGIIAYQQAPMLTEESLEQIESFFMHRPITRQWWHDGLRWLFPLLER